MKTEAPSLVGSDFKSLDFILRVKWYKAVRRADEKQTLRARSTVSRYMYVANIVCAGCGKTIADLFANPRLRLRGVMSGSTSAVTVPA